MSSNYPKLARRRCKIITALHVFPTSKRVMENNVKEIRAVF